MKLKLKNPNFTNIKNPISVYDLDINKQLVSSKVFFSRKGFKYFVKHGKNVRPLCIMLSTMSTYRRDFYETKYMLLLLLLFFLVKNDKLLEKYNLVIKSAIPLKKDLIVNLFTMKDINKLK